MPNNRTLHELKAELSRCEKELEDAKLDTRSSHVRLSAALIRLGRAQCALEEYEAATKEQGEE